MIGYLPQIYENEILYSYVARYHRCTSLNSLKDTLEDLFGVRSIAASLEFPSHLGKVESHLNVIGLSKEKLLYEHTLYPLYEPFLYEEEQAIIKDMIFGNNGGGIKGKIGFLAGSVCKKEHFYYCPLCVRDDVEKYGETYLRVLHQMQGVFACPKHQCWLEKYPVTQKMVGRVEFVSLDLGVISDVRPRFIRNEELLGIVLMFEQILEGALVNLSAEVLEEKYLYRLGQMNLLTVEKRVKFASLCNLFNNAYQKTTLELLDSFVDYSNVFNWLAKLFWKKRIKLHPIRHLLLINFLFEDISELAKMDIKEEKVFYPCLNPVGGHYKELTIKEVIVTADSHSRIPVGTFECPICGFIYSRKMAGDVHTIGRIKKFGPVWENELLKIKDRKDLSLRAKARHMGCDPKTILKYQ
jgi:hypothetical protein